MTAATATVAVPTKTNVMTPIAVLFGAALGATVAFGVAAQAIGNNCIESGKFRTATHAFTCSAIP